MEVKVASQGFHDCPPKPHYMKIDVADNVDISYLSSAGKLVSILESYLIN